MNLECFDMIDNVPHRNGQVLLLADGKETTDILANYLNRYTLPAYEFMFGRYHSISKGDGGALTYRLHMSHDGKCRDWKSANIDWCSLGWYLKNAYRKTPIITVSDFLIRVGAMQIDVVEIPTISLEGVL